MYTPDGKIEPIPGTAFGVMPVRLYSDNGDHRSAPTGYVLTQGITPTHYITLPGLFLHPLGAVKEAITLTEIEMRKNDPESE